MTDDVSSRLRRVAPAAQEPITLSEAKLFLRIEHDAEDAVITRAIVAAREACEQLLATALLPQSFELIAACDGTRRVVLPIGPASAIDSVVLTDTGGGESEFDETLFRLSVDGFSLFFNHAPVGVSVTVSYDASLADNAAGLPALLKQGMLHHVAALVEARDGTAPMPLASLQCYQPFRQVRL